MSPKSPLPLSQQCFPSLLSQILFQFLVFLAGALPNAIFMLVPWTEIYWLIDFRDLVWAQGVFHQALYSSRLQTLSLSPLGTRWPGILGRYLGLSPM